MVLRSERVKTPVPPDEPLVLVERRSRSARLLVTCLVLVAGSLLTVATNGPAAGWIGLVFFLPCTGVFMFNLVKPPRLILTREGFRFINLWRKSALFEWHRARDFHPFSVAWGTTLIAFTYDGDAARWHGLLARANRALSDGNAALPTTYGMKPHDLANLLERWRREQDSA